jgi:MFS family permease
MTRLQATLAALCAVQLIDVMGVTVIVSSLPGMLDELGGSPAQAGLVVPVYAVGFASLLLVSARLGDRYGHRRLLLGGLVVFAAGSVLAAIAPGMTALVAARGVQGIAAAVTVPNALVLLTGLAGSDTARERALGAWNACGGLAGALGLVVGGIVTTTLGWRTIFWANLVLALLMAVVLARMLPARPPTTTTTTGAPLPVLSAVLQVVAIGALVAAANTAEHSLAASQPVLVLAVVAAAALVWCERRTRRPLVPAGLWPHRGFLAGLAGSFGLTATTSGFVIVTTLYLQNTQGLTAAAAGLMILPFSLAVVIAAAITGRLVSRVGAHRVLVTGLALITTSIVLVAAWPSLTTVLLAGIANGAGNGAAAVAAYALATSLAAEYHGAAAGLLNTAAQMGTAVVVALAVAVASHGDGGLDHRAGWLTAAAASTLVIAALALTQRGRTPVHDHAGRG